MAKKNKPAKVWRTYQADVDCFWNGQLFKEGSRIESDLDPEQIPHHFTQIDGEEISADEPIEE